MSRAKLEKGQQREFLNRVAKYYDFDWPKIAKISNICERSLRDWRREKINMSYRALLKLHRISNIPLPKIIKILPEHWSVKKASRLGAIRRNELYGNPGTADGRRRGGIISQRRFEINPDYARQLGFKVKKMIKYPRKSSLLTEFIGVLLGDGGITDYQIKITFNRDTDKEYATFLQGTIKKLFDVHSTITINKGSDKGEDIVVSAKNLVEFLERRGLKRGNKVKNKVNIPRWILNNKSYTISCLRGLIDTDGSFYPYRHKVFKKKYYNFAMCFTNHSPPLLKSVYNILKTLRFSPITNGRNRVYLHRQKDIDRYFLEISTSNPKHLGHYKDYISKRGDLSGGVRKWS